jgi:hypothetical protein
MIMNAPVTNRFHDVASALAYSLAQPHETTPELAPPHNDLTQFILTQHAQMPDYLRAPMKLAAFLFDWSGWRDSGKSFHTPVHLNNAHGKSLRGKIPARFSARFHPLL